jgi:hypothetical protein
MRVKSSWHGGRGKRAGRSHKKKSLGDIAGALAFIVWKISRNGVENLINEKFDVISHEQLFGIISEYLIFLIQSSDRLVYKSLSQEQRGEFIQKLALKLADHLQENQVDRMGEGDYRSPFIHQLNAEIHDYSEFSFSEDGPGYPFMCYFAEQAGKTLSEDDRKWFVAQVVEIEGPEAIEMLRKGVTNLFGFGFIEECQGGD